MTPDIYKTVASVYKNLGQPGSFSNFAKIKQALKAKNINYSDLEIRAALKKIESYEKFRKRRRTLPAHVSRRVTEVSAPDLWWFTDSFYIKKFKGPYKFVSIYVDAFSREIFARPLVKLKAAITARLFNEICEQDNDGIYPETVLSDKGAEYHGVYSANLKEKNIRQVFTNVSQSSKAFLAERAVRTLKKILSKMLAEGIKDLAPALKAAVSAYNTSVHSRLNNLTPKEAAKPENRMKIIDFRRIQNIKTMDKHFRQIENINSKFKVGQLVRYKTPTPDFTKETAENALFSEEIYRITKIVPSFPTFGYKIAPLNSDVSLPPTFLSEQLLKV